ncbi:hypothetical protein D6D18_06042 [Aureobasidium pullulans]|nr:hypothetical protein D6D18_06042 [Aureobasidium pullulans]
MCIWAGKTVIEAITAHDVREAEGRSSHDIPAVLKDVSQAEHLTPCSAPAQLRQRYTRQLNSSQYIKHQHTNMPYFTSSEEWQKQSALLLQARPNTTRITTKYHIPSASSISTKPTTTTDAPTESKLAQQPIAYLELKTYDPISGTTLKYKTDKAAEVGRLVAAMGSLGREMAALPEIKQDITMPDADETPVVEAAATPATAQQQQQQQSTGGKKKKKGKK